MNQMINMNQTLIVNNQKEPMKLRDRGMIQKYSGIGQTLYSQFSNPEMYEEAIHSENAEKWKDAMNEEM